MRAVAFQTSLLPVCDFLQQQAIEEIAVGPAFLLGLSDDLLVGLACVRQVETVEHGIELSSERDGVVIDSSRLQSVSA